MGRSGGGAFYLLVTLELSGGALQRTIVLLDGLEDYLGVGMRG